MEKAKGRIITRDKSFYINLIALAIPIALQNLITFLVNMADNVMIGTLGDNAISGVYMGGQLQTVIQMFIGGIEGAVAILSAQYWGKKDIKSIKKIIAAGAAFAVSFGIIFTLAATIFPNEIVLIFTREEGVVSEGAKYLQIIGFSYIFFCITQVSIAAMRSVETARIGLYVSLLALVVNVGLNYIFIFGIEGYIPRMEVEGAALATLISRIIEMTVVLVYVFFRDKKLKLKLKELISFDKVIVRDFIKYGLPLMGGQVVWSCNMLGNSMILGQYSSGVMAATSIASMLSNLVYVFTTGLSNSVGIITGKTVGQGLYDKMKEYAKTVQIIFLCLGAVMGVSIYFIKGPFISMYNTSAESAMYADQFINVLAVVMIGTCYQASCLFGLVKSGGDISFVFKNDSIFVFCVVLPSAIISSYLGAPPWVVFACLKCDQILKCFVAVVKINRFNWMKNLTRETT